jgi:site-specific recombinase XerD
MRIDRTENPYFLNEYVTHLSVVKCLSDGTVMGYYQDIRLFLRFVMFCHLNPDTNPTLEQLSEVSIRSMPPELLNQVTLRDIYAYYSFLADECGNRDKARSRKASSLRSFFRYLTRDTHLVEADPTANLELSAPKNALPKYLNLDESLSLLRTLTMQENHRAHIRDYCILTLFLNCGIRLSELVGLNLSSLDLKNSRMRVLGKGSKERIVYLNEACLSALREYLFERSRIETADIALFLSNQKKRISRRRVQQIVEDSLAAAGLQGRGLSTHKLRHTAATLMYQHGHVDVLTLKSILGHESISTTEIYTHLSDVSVREAMEHSPLAEEKRISLEKK